MSFDFSPVIEVLSSFKSKYELDKFLIKQQFTFKSYPAKKVNDTDTSDLPIEINNDKYVDLPNEWIYVIKHPYGQNEQEEYNVYVNNTQPEVTSLPQTDFQSKHTDNDVTDSVPKAITTNESEEIIDDPRLELLHQFGRGIVFRINMNQQPFNVILMSVPLPFGHDDFLEQHNLTDSIVSMLIDGTGFNVSKDPMSNLLFVSTRACGGYYPEGPLNYFGNSKYRYGKMFREALQHVEHTEYVKLNEKALLDLPPNVCLHLVMQHPNDPKVFPIKKPCLTLVSAYNCVNPSAVVSHQTNLSEFQASIKTQFNMPMLINISSNEILQSFMTNSHPTTFPGLKMYNTITHKWSKRVFTDRYKRVKELIGNDSNIVYTLIRLRHSSGQFIKMQKNLGVTLPQNHVSDIKEFLQYFPDYSKMYYVITNLCKLATSEILDWYLQVYAHPTSNKYAYIQNRLSLVPYEFNDIVQQLHKNYKDKKTIYTQNLQNVKSDTDRATLVKPETRHKDVVEFFNSMPPARIYDRLRQFTNRKMSELQANFKDIDFNLENLFSY